MDAPRVDLDALKAAVAPFPEARFVALFGSVARGDALPTSDVDIAVSGCPFWRALELGHAAGSAVHREPHVVDLDRASDVLRYEVARDGILLREAEPHLWVRFRAEAVVRYLDFKPVMDLCAEGVRRRLRREAGIG